LHGESCGSGGFPGSQKKTWDFEQKVAKGAKRGGEGYGSVGGREIGKDVDFEQKGAEGAKRGGEGYGSFWRAGNWERRGF
jgi:hypothetical protein